MSTITTESHVFFYTSYLSNWWSTRDIKPQFTDPITGLVWNNTEEAFMAAKARFFGDEETHALIVAHAAARRHPREVKDLGRLVKRYDEKAWSCVRVGAMTYPNLLKYQQNPDLGAQLKGTGDRVLVEASPVDKTWGVGLSVTDAAAWAQAHYAEMEIAGSDAGEIDWPGLNLLGQALMTVRSMLP